MFTKYSRARTRPYSLRGEQLESRHLLSRGPVITEFMSSNTHTLNDGNGESSDWIEIYNDSPEAIDLAKDFYLTDDPDNLQLWKFPDEPASVLEPQEYLIVFASGNNLPDPAGSLHANFQLSRKGEYLALTRDAGDAGMQVVNEFGSATTAYPIQRTDTSFGIPFENSLSIGTNSELNAIVATTEVDSRYGRNWTGGNEQAFVDASGSSDWINGLWGIGHRPNDAIGRYRDLVTAESSLISLYTFDNDDTEADRIHDVAGTGTHHGTANGPIDFGEGVRGASGRSLSLDGKGFVEMGIVADFVFRDNSLTVEAWVRPTFEDNNSSRSWFGTRTQSRTGGNRLDRYTVRIDGDYQGVRTTSSTGSRFAAHPLTPGEWIHVVAVFNDQQVDQYVNGALIDSDGIGGIGSTPLLVQTQIGTSGLASRTDHFIGQIDEVAIYEDILSAETIRQHYETFAFSNDSLFLGTDVGKQMIGTSGSVYARSTFVLDNPADVSSLTFETRFTDGYAAYINGVPIGETNSPDRLNHDSLAVNGKETIEIETFAVTGDLSFLRTGGNVLAIHGLNSSIDEGGYLVQPSLIAHQLEPSISFLREATPGGPNTEGFAGFATGPNFDIGRGVFDHPIDVTLSGPTGFTLVYTTDGTQPTADHGTIVEPSGDGQSAQTTLTMKSGLTVLRAATFNDGFMPSTTISNSYFVLDDLDAVKSLGLRQSRVIDEHVDTIIDHLTEIPTMSLSVDEQLMFGPTGIHSQTLRFGRDFEIPISVEFIDPTKQQDFQIDAGIRLHGNGARTLSKKQFRIFLRPEYGEDVLNFQLFEDSPIDEFRTFILRPGAHDSWAFSSFGSLIRDPFLRQTQLEMGQPAARSRFVHLYINGKYWGLYYPTERPDADFATSHLGGNKEDWDSLNSGLSQVADGNLNRWQETADLIGTGPVNDQTFAAMEQLVDLENQMDDIMLRIWSGDEDWGGSRNYYVIGNREEGRFKFIVWDAEISLGFNLDRHRTPVTLNKLSEGRLPVAKAAGSQGGTFWWLAGHPEYRIRFADRLQRNFFGDGAMSVENMTARWESLVDKIDGPIVLEAAKRGSNGSLTNWRREVNWVRDNWIKHRVPIVLEDFQEIGLYPSVSPPQYLVNGSLNFGGIVETPANVTIEGPVTGTLYYTRDGTDPRLVGGAVSKTAIPIDPREILAVNEGLTLKARVLEGDAWSALSEAVFLTQQPTVDATSLRITEVHYNPASPRNNSQEEGYDKDEFEFIELTNISAQDIDLTGVRLSQEPVGDSEQGVDFVFATGSIRSLAPGKRVVVVENTEAFMARYGTELPVAGQWSGGLGNGGELITLTVNSEIIQQFTYDDAWHPATDGNGPSLEIINPSGEITLWNRAAGWQASNNAAGSPGTAQGRPGDANGDGIFSSADLVLAFQSGGYEDDIDGNSSFAQGDWNGDGDFTSQDLVLAFTIGGYVSDARSGRLGPLPLNATDLIFGDEDSLTELFDKPLMNTDRHSCMGFC